MFDLVNMYKEIYSRIPLINSPMYIHAPNPIREAIRLRPSNVLYRINECGGQCFICNYLLPKKEENRVMLQVFKTGIGGERELGGDLFELNEIEFWTDD